MTHIDIGFLPLKINDHDKTIDVTYNIKYDGNG